MEMEIIDNSTLYYRKTRGLEVHAACRENRTQIPDPSPTQQISPSKQHRAIKNSHEVKVVRPVKPESRIAKFKQVSSSRCNTHLGCACAAGGLKKRKTALWCGCGFLRGFRDWRLNLFRLGMDKILIRSLDTDTQCTVYIVACYSVRAGAMASDKSIQKYRNWAKLDKIRQTQNLFRFFVFAKMATENLSIWNLLHNDRSVGEFWDEWLNTSNP